MSARKTKLIPLTDLSQHSDGEFSFQSGEMESPADSTSDNVPVTETVPVKPKLKKRGSSGLANLQKARMKKTLRRERMRTLLQQRAKQKKQNGEKPAKVKAEEPESSDGQSDYFLGKRKETNSEKLVIALRLTKLVKKLHEGANVCKTPPAPIKDETQFPILNMIRGIGAWIDTKKNPVEWSSNEAFFFVKQLNIPDSKIIAKMFRSEEIDGEALLNLSERDLTHRFQINPTTSSAFIKVFTGLREEVIKRYINF